MGVSYPGGQSPDKAARAWAAMMRRTTDLGPAMKVGAESVNRLLKMSFQNSVTPTGEKWDGLDPETVKRRRKQSNKPLIDTGTLRNSTYARGGARTIYFGTNIGYAGFHQFGTRRIPARPFLPITAQGELTMAGPAKIVFDRIKAQVGSYIVNGKLVR